MITATFVRNDAFSSSTLTYSLACSLGCDCDCSSKIENEETDDKIMHLRKGTFNSNSEAPSTIEMIGKDEGSPLTRPEDVTVRSSIQDVLQPLNSQQQEHGGDMEAPGAYSAISATEDNGTHTDEYLWMESLWKLQTLALVLAHGLAILAMAIVIGWIRLLGGLSWKAGNAKLVFNWHPLLMITSFCFMTVASFSFRFRTIANRQMAKLLHGMTWTIAALCAGVAVLAVVRSHNDAQSGFIANLYSLHSWIGLLVIVLYVLQFLAGVITFGGWSDVTPSLKAKILAVHYFVGPLVYLSTAVTILLGLQEKEGFIGCAYKVTQADTFPLQHFGEIPLVCRVSHFLGIVIVAMTFCTLFAMHNFHRGSFRRH